MKKNLKIAIIVCMCIAIINANFGSKINAEQTNHSAFNNAIQITEEYSCSIKAGEEKILYFIPKNCIAYEISINGSSNIEATVYNEDFVQLDKRNAAIFTIHGNYWGKVYLKLASPYDQTGTYKISVKERFEIPKILDINTFNDNYVDLEWSKISNANGYDILISTLTGYSTIGTVRNNVTQFRYSYTNDTRGKVLCFQVRAIADDWNAGEYSKKSYSRNDLSFWKYSSNMPEAKNDFASAVLNNEICTQYLQEKGYDVINESGKIAEYVLDKEKLMDLPWIQYWQLQTDVDSFIGKKIETYSFTIKNNPLDNYKGNKKKQTSAWVMISDGKVAGGYTLPVLGEPLAGSVYSIEGKTLEEVSGMSYSKFCKIWDKKYK